MSETVTPTTPTPTPTTPTATPTTPAPTPTAAWHAGKADGEVLGFWQNKGWNVADPAEIAIQATKAYHEAQKFIGVPPDSLLRMPKDASDAEGWKAVWSRLGAPADATGYDFSTVKKADGTAADTAFLDAMRATAAELNLPKDAASTVAARVLKHMETSATSAAADHAAKLALEHQALAQNWGANKEANLFVAKQAALKLGITPEVANALESQIGYAKVMEMFRNIGTKIGEDKFVASPAPGQSGVMSVDQAKAQKSALMSDVAWRNRYLAADTTAVNEMTALNTLIANAMMQ